MLKSGELIDTLANSHLEGRNRRQLLVQDQYVERLVAGSGRVATFAQTKAPQHPEAYGLVMGGRNLADSTQSYTYFIIRTMPDKAEFSIRRRAGYAVRPTAVVDWTANAAVKPADAAGKATNKLSVLVSGGKATFYVNGTEVHSANAADVDVNGIVAYRVNHNLDVHLSPLGIHKR